MRRQERASSILACFVCSLPFVLWQWGSFCLLTVRGLTESVAACRAHLLFLQPTDVCGIFFHALFPQDVNERLVKMTFVMADYFPSPFGDACGCVLPGWLRLIR